MKQSLQMWRDSLPQAGVLALWMVLHLGVADAADECGDAGIAGLQGRIDALERRLAELELAGSGERTGSSVQQPAQASPAASPPAWGSPPRWPDPAVAPAADPAPASIGADMERALERALVREGGLLLPPAAIEVEPRWSYQHRASSGLDLLDASGIPQLAQVTRRRDLQQAALGFRIGLPAQSQLELFLPYASVRERHSVIGGGSSAESLSGFGAAEIGLSWQLRSTAAGTGVVAGLRWIEPASSRFDGDLSASAASGFRAWHTSLLFITRRDPVVIFGALSHAARRGRRIAGYAIDPGDATGLRAGAIIALSPDTSLRLGLDLLRSGDARVAGVPARGSGGISGEFSTGFSFVLSPRTLLGVEAAIGLTETAPDFRIGLSLPVRF